MISCYEILVWSCCAGGFSRERTNLLSLHQLHRRALWVLTEAIRSHLWPGIIELDTQKKFWIHLLSHYSFVFSFCVSQLAVASPFYHSNLLVMLWQLFDTSIFFIHMQMIVILTKSVNRCFEKNPKFDMTSLLGGTDTVFSSLIHSFCWFVSLIGAVWSLLF